MSVDSRSLGRCPFCDVAVPRDNVLIEYERGLYAECPGCGDPVHPK